MFIYLYGLYILAGYSFLNAFSSPVLSFFEDRNVGSVSLVTCPGKSSNLHEKQLREIYLKNDNRMLLHTIQKLDSLHPTFTAQYYKTGVYLDFSCTSSKEVFSEMSNNLLFNLSFTILISADNYEDTIKFLELSSIAFDSDITLNVGNRYYDLYRTGLSQSLISTLTGIYIDSKFVKNITRKRNDLNGIIINSGIVWTKNEFPLNTSAEGIEKLMDFRYEPELGFLSRYGFAVHSMIEEAFNFRMNLIIYHDWGYYQEKNKTWSEGMFKGIFLNQIDLGISISRIFSQRMDVSIFYPPYLKFRTCFLFKHPSTFAEPTALIKPFTLGSWLCTLSVVVLSACFTWYIRTFRLPDIPPNEPDFVDNFTVALGTICQQGISSDSLRLSLRVLHTFLLITSFLIYIFYGGAVVGFLLSPSPRTINTLDKLVASPIIPYAENLQYHKKHFLGNFSEKVTRAYEAIKERKTKEERWIELMAGIEKVRLGKIALYSQDTNLYRAVEKVFSNSDICSLTEIEISILRASTVVRKKSPYKELLYRGMISLHENGLLDRTIKTWQAQRPVCYSQEESVTVSLEATLVAHIIYSSGLFLSLVVFALEIQIAKLSNNKSKITKFE